VGRVTDQRQLALTMPPRLLQYQLPGGWEVLVGRSDADNDYLSLKLAAPADWWFHVHGMPGSHVILRARRDMEPDRGTLERAAAIAAYYSKARTGGVTPVSCTRARDVSKPRGARPGTVQIRREKLLKVRPGLPEPSPDRVSVEEDP
jgi:predicted ribosome quality control (RQC) complex YloA/Tae2 family protein